MTDSDNPQGGNAPTRLTSQDAAVKLDALFGGTEEPRTTPEVRNQEAPEPEPEQDEEQGEVEAAGEETPEAEGTEEQPEGDDDGTDSTIELSDETEIDLDGDRITFRELKAQAKQAKELQRDYTRKTQAISEDRKVIEEKAQSVAAFAQQLTAERDALLQIVQEFLPQPPQRPTVSPAEDPIGWMEYQAAREEYDGKVGKLQQARSQHEAQMRQVQEQRQRELAEKVVPQERERLLERYPKLRDPDFANKTRGEMVDIISKRYGFAPDEIANVADHRAVSMMLDLIEYHRLKAAAPAAKVKVETKPPLVKAAKRPDPATQKARANRDQMDKLRRTGRMEDAVAILNRLGF